MSDANQAAQVGLGGFPPPRLVAFDLDGVVYRGATLLPFVVEAVRVVRERGLLVRYVTNNATLHREQVAGRLRELGLEAATDQVLTSAAAASSWLSGRLPAQAPVVVVGEAGLRRELREAGLRAIHAEGAPAESYAAVVVGLDRSFTYAALAAAQAAVHAGALLVATNRDPTLPVEGRLLPGAGSLLAAVEAAAGARAVVMGKPESGLAEALADDTDVTSAATLFIGDRLDTDVAFGLASGMQTVLVYTGVTRREDLRPGDPRPHHELDDLGGLGGLLDRLGVPG